MSISRPTDPRKPPAAASRQDRRELRRVLTRLPFAWQWLPTPDGSGSPDYNALDLAQMFGVAHVLQRQAQAMIFDAQLADLLGTVDAAPARDGRGDDARSEDSRLRSAIGVLSRKIDLLLVPDAATEPPG